MGGEDHTPLPPGRAPLFRGPADPVQRQIGIAVGHRQPSQGVVGRTGRPGRAGLDHHPADARPSQHLGIGSGQQQPLHLAGPAALAGHRPAPDEQIPGGEHLGANPPRQRIEDGCMSRPLEPAHALRRQYRHRSRVGVDPVGHLMPTRGVVHRPHLPAHAPGQVGQAREHRAAAQQPRHRRSQPAAQHQHRARPGQRVAGHRQRHPLLPVAQHRQSGGRVGARLQQCQTGAGGHRRGKRDAHRRQRQQRCGNAVA